MLLTFLFCIVIICIFLIFKKYKDSIIVLLNYFVEFICYKLLEGVFYRIVLLRYSNY
jgi:hypothetical protein